MSRAKKINQIRPGDLICHSSLNAENIFAVLILSVEEKNVTFILLGENHVYSAVTTEESYHLLSRRD